MFFFFFLIERLKRLLILFQKGKMLTEDSLIRARWNLLRLFVHVRSRTKKTTVGVLDKFSSIAMLWSLFTVVFDRLLALLLVFLRSIRGPDRFLLCTVARAWSGWASSLLTADSPCCRFLRPTFCLLSAARQCPFRRFPSSDEWCHCLSPHRICLLGDGGLSWPRRLSAPSACDGVPGEVPPSSLTGWVWWSSGWDWWWSCRWSLPAGHRRGSRCGWWTGDEVSAVGVENAVLWNHRPLTRYLCPGLLPWISTVAGLTPSV